MTQQYEAIGLSVPNFSGNEKKYVNEAIDAEWVSTAGAFISRFEEEMAKTLEVPQACACQSGTAGLHLCLRHFGVGAGDIVLVPTLTFIAPINAVMYQAATPVFFDCDSHMCMDAGQVEEYLSRECRVEDGKTVEISSGKTVKAMLPVHVFGDHCDMDRLMDLAEAYHLYVIEDATESVGGVFSKGRYAGLHTGTVGHAGVLSFNGNKIITTGGGGMVISRDAAAIEHIRYLSQQAKNDTVYFVHEEYGYNYRMTDFQAALLLSQLKKLDRFAERRKEIVRRYNEAFQMLPEIIVQEEIPESDTCRHLYIIRLDLERLACTRRQFYDAMAAENVQCQIHYVPVYWFPYYRHLGYKKGLCPNAEEIYKGIVSIPLYPRMTGQDVEDVIRAVEKIVQHYRK